MKRKYNRRVETINLPPDILKSIDRDVEYRKALGLLDDKEERIKRAIRYQEFINGI